MTPTISQTKIVFENLNARIIFFVEMQGQLSDGQWENAEPFDHWKPWCDIEWNESRVGPDFGRRFAAPVDTYRFGSNELLGIVGERIRWSVCLIKALSANPDGSYDEALMGRLIADHWSLPQSADTYRRVRNGKGYPHEQAYLAKWERLCITDSVIAEVEADYERYTYAWMQQDCRAIGRAAKRVYTRDDVRLR